MQYIKYGDMQLPAASLQAEKTYRDGEVLTITFAETVTYAEISALYDPQNPAYDTDMLHRMEVLTDEGRDGEGNPVMLDVRVSQGIHLGYTKPLDITRDLDAGVYKVRIQRESALETRLRALEQDLASLQANMQ